MKLAFCSLGVTESQCGPTGPVLEGIVVLIDEKRINEPGIKSWLDKNFERVPWLDEPSEERQLMNKQW